MQEHKIVPMSRISPKPLGNVPSTEKHALRATQPKVQYYIIVREIDINYPRERLHVKPDRTAGSPPNRTGSP
jgi:hypothetical protein